MILRAGFLAVAHKLQESATAMCHEDIRTRLSDSLNDAFRGTGTWCYVVAVFGDDKTGDVVYSSSSDLKKAAYTITGANCTIDTANAVDVQPLTTYEVETKDVAIGEAGARNSKRDLKQLQTIHDAATSLGANCSMQESHKRPSTSGLKLIEGAEFLQDIPLLESAAVRTNYPIRIISPGTGSTAHYPAEVLKREAAKFKSGTLMFWNHPTSAEESARPEGNLDNLAAITTSQGEWKDDGPKGPGIYAEAAVMAHYAEKVQSLAPHIGVSIRAGGNAEGGGRQVDGKPVLKEFTHIESVDYVTKAGRGGLALAEAARGAGILTEAAKPANPNEGGATEMDAAELKKLQEAVTAQAALNAQLLGRAIRGDAREEAGRILAGITMHEAVKAEVVTNVLRDIPTKDGALDTAKFTESVNAEAKRLADLAARIAPQGGVRGMGAGIPAPVKQTADQVKESKERAKEEFDEEVAVYQRLGLTEAAAQNAARGRAA